MPLLPRPLSCRLASLCAALFLSAPAFAHGVTAGALTISHPWIALPASSAQAAAGYMRITNSGDHADRLIGVEAGFAGQSMLHESRTDAQGVTRMVHLPAIELPPGGTVTLAPGGLHVMFMGLAAPLSEYAREPATLVFEEAGRVPVEFSVDTPKNGAAALADETAGHAGHSPAP